MLLSGDAALIEKIQPELAKMTGQILQFGEEVGKAAAIKLMGNAYLVCFTAGVRDTLAVAKSLDLTVDDVSSLFSSWNPGAQVHARLSRMAAADYQNPSWELAMARKDTGLFLEAAGKAEMELAVLPAIAYYMDQWITKGHGNEDWTVIAKDCL
jgi:3-hydroxyisobutyrate dehydrogenase